MHVLSVTEYQGCKYTLVCSQQQEISIMYMYVQGLVPTNARTCLGGKYSSHLLMCRWYSPGRRHCDLRESNLLLDAEAALDPITLEKEFWVAAGLPWASMCWEVREGLR